MLGNEWLMFQLYHFKIFYVQCFTRHKCVIIFVACVRRDDDHLPGSGLSRVIWVEMTRNYCLLSIKEGEWEPPTNILVTRNPNWS